jgi:hypothetical protein
LRRNVEHSPDQPISATFGIPARSSVDFDRHFNICLRVSQQSFPGCGNWGDAAAAGRLHGGSRNRPAKENRAPRLIDFIERADPPGHR